MQVEHQPLFGRSVLRCREARNRSRKRNFRTERPFSLAHRIGSVIREQRPARATTRTTGCSLNAAERVETPWNPRCLITRQQPSENIRWSSRPSPVNRLQATGEPKYRESGRRVMLGGSKSDQLGSKEQDRPAPVVNHRESSRFHQRTDSSVQVQHWYSTVQISTGTVQTPAVQHCYKPFTRNHQLELNYTKYARLTTIRRFKFTGLRRDAAVQRSLSRSLPFG